MTKVLILGANGQLARNMTRVFLRDTDAWLTLYLRRASRLRIRTRLASRSWKATCSKLALTPGKEVRRSLGVSRG